MSFTVVILLLMKKDSKKRRPIMSFINSPLYNLFKFFVKILSPLAGRTGHTVKNSYEFVDTITGLKLDDDEF